EAEEDDNATGATGYLGLYLGLRPEDDDVLARYALLCEQTAKSIPERVRAFFILERVLQRDDSRTEVRHRLVPLAMSLDRFADAKVHLEILLLGAREDPKLQGQMALCEEASAHFAPAAEWYFKAIEGDPQQLGSHERLAYLLRQRLDRPKDADDVMKR